MHCLRNKNRKACRQATPALGELLACGNPVGSDLRTEWVFLVTHRLLCGDRPFSTPSSSSVTITTAKMSDMDSDCDDVFTDDAKTCSPFDDLKSSSTGDDDGRHLVNRKRRRGIIEKRRRDRINNSLSELRRLVPAAFEKQGSAKLEKAEILQMTVDHLRILHTKGMDVFSFDHHPEVMDYHGIGFRECASEVARYLVGFEGLELQDPLRLRLMSHLQCFTSQRDAGWLSALSSPLHPRRSPALSTYGSLQDFPMYSSSSTDRSSGGGSLSTDSKFSPRGRIPISPIALSASSLIGRQSVIVQEAPPRPYRPWGTEMAY